MKLLGQILLFLGSFAFVLESVADPGARTRLLGKTPSEAPRISQPKFSWEDAQGIWGNGRNGEGDQNGNGANASGAGKGNGGKGSGLGNGAGTEFTQSGAGNGSGSGNGGGGKTKIGGDAGSPGASGGTASGGSNLTIHSLWWPLCLFADDTLDPGVVNAAIKGQTEMANRCGVNLVVWAKTTASSTLPDDYETVNKNTVAACNITEAGLASAASASAFVKHDLTAAKMCDVKLQEVPTVIWDPAVAGCAELASGSGGATAKQLATQGGHGNSGGKVAASIEVPKGHNANVLAHESQGHSQMGQPNGSRLGNGIGSWAEIQEYLDKGQKPPDNHDASGDWTGEGCAKMRETALPNDKRFGFDPTQQTYYVPPKDPSAVYKLGIDPPIFKPGEPMVANSQQVPPLNTPPGQKITMIDTPKQQNPSSPPAQKPTQTAGVKDEQPKVEPEMDARHRKKGMAAKTLIEAVEGETEGEINPPRSGKPSPPPPWPPVKPGPRIGFDESAPKGRSVKSGGETVTSAEPAPQNAYGSGPLDDADGTSNAGATMAGDGQGGSGKGASITFDENAPKGGMVGSLPGASGKGGGSAQAAAEAAAAARLGAVIRQSGSWKSSLDDDEEFFDEEEIGEDGQKVKRKKKSARKTINRDPGAGRRPASLEQRAPSRR